MKEIIQLLVFLAIAGVVLYLFHHKNDSDK